MSEATCATPTCDPATGPVTDRGGPSEAPGTDRTDVLDGAEGWQALALAVLDRELTEPEVAAAERLPVDVALDLFFPDLDAAARHEALWALDRPPA